MRDERPRAPNILAAKQEPYFALIGGDLAYDNGPPRRPPRSSELRQAHDRPEGAANSAGVTCIGNHEVSAAAARASDDDATFYLPLFDGLYPETTYGDARLRRLPEPRAARQRPRLADRRRADRVAGERSCAERQDRPHLIVANHVPAYPSYRNPGSRRGRQLDDVGLKEKPGGTGEENRKHWCPLFEKYRVDVVLEHHDHTFKRTQPLIGGLQTSTACSTWATARGAGFGHRPHRKSGLTSRWPPTYHMSVHKLEGDQRYQRGGLEEGGKIADVYSTIGKPPRQRG